MIIPSAPLIARLEAAEDVLDRLAICNEFGGDIRCQFCDEGDFDLVGLKLHLDMGWCQVLALIPTLAEERDNRAALRARAGGER
jgi:hypothetical protein